jgi:integrase
VYCDARGYALIAQLTIADMDRFYAAWKDGKRAKAKKLERLKSFVRFCLKREWLSKDIAEDLDAPEGSSIPAHKTPFTDDELERIFTACDKLLPVSAGPGHRGWSGADVKDFMLLSMYTGLRISDVATFDMTKRLKGNDVFRRIYRVVSGGRRRHCHRSDAVALRRPSPCVGIGHSLRPRHGRGDCATEGLTQRARNGVSQRGGEAFWEDSTREALRYTLPPLYGFRGDGCLRQAAPIFCWRRSHNEAA